MQDGDKAAGGGGRPAEGRPVRPPFPTNSGAEAAAGGRAAEGKAKAKAAGPPPRDMPDAEYKRLFISLIDPTATARTGRCLEIAALIGAYSAGAGWDQGVRAARLLEGVYRDMSEMLDRSAADGAMWHATTAVGDTLDYLRRFGRAYRDGAPPEPVEFVFCTDEAELAARRDEGDLDPMVALEKLRSKVASLGDEVSRMPRSGEGEKEEGGPGYPPELAGPGGRPETCRRAIMMDEQDLRRSFRERGDDYIFPPKAEGIVGMLSGYRGTGESSLELVRQIRGRGGP